LKLLRKLENKMKIHFLGTCSGTEPMPDMHHCSLAFDINGVYYWFDAGEGCSHTAMTKMGIDLSRIRSIFISHPHIDHVGGLANLLYTLNKLVWRGFAHIDDAVNVFLPSEELFSTVTALAFGSRKTYHLAMNNFTVNDGVLFEDENIKVTARHTTHLGEDGSSGWHAYSYLIEAEGKKVLFSGDVGSFADLDGQLEGGVDILIMETGHHKVLDVLDFAKQKCVKKLFFNHHGREILENRAAAQAKIDTHSIDAVITTDCLTVDI
jgi:ribonuclease BN (tRNA processing enzyme)